MLLHNMCISANLAYDEDDDHDDHGSNAEDDNEDADIDDVQQNQDGWQYRRNLIDMRFMN